MHYYRAELPIRATHTNNHIESFNRKIKRRIKRNMHFTKALEELLLLTDEHYEDILKKTKYSIKINTTKYNEDWLNQIKTDFSKKCLELVQEENTLLINGVANYKILNQPKGCYDIVNTKHQNA
jgi:hypothetical protein